MTLHLILLVVYSTVVVTVGLWTARYVRTSSAFFVAGRSLGPGLVLASMLAVRVLPGMTWSDIELVCVLIVAAYFVIVLGFHSLGMNYLITPAQAAWAPVLTMVPWAVARSSPLRR